LTVTAEDIRNAGANVADIEGVIDYSLYINGVQIGVLFKQVDDSEVKVSFRCREGYDILPVAAHFGGGGHHHAAGCSVEGSLENAHQLMLEALGRMLGQNG